MPIKAILFDLDNVLLSMSDNHYKSLNKALKEIVGYEIPYDEHMKYYNGISTKAKLKMLNNRGLVYDNQEEEIEKLKQNYTVEFINMFKKDKIKIVMMQKLKENYKLACVSNSIRKTLNMMLKQIGVYEYLDLILGNEDFGDRIKPDPFPYQLAMQQLNINAQEAVIVEDSEKGIISAKRSGAHVFEVKDDTEVFFENVNNFIKSIK